MSQEKKGSENDEEDEHEHDMVMPGFRFHPTEEELVEFYLRRKVEGKRFNVELITFLDLYRYDPWELPALAAIGEKEWFFYVPRDRKYRNGDRPNRVTTSGYWKATGADRMIRTENFRSIGLKKTLVFYSGKAPKGIRTSWIMNEYRLPQHDTERYQKAEISLCRVYKRAGVEDPRSLPTRASSSSSRPTPIIPSSSSPEKKHATTTTTTTMLTTTTAQFSQSQNTNETEESSSPSETSAFLGLSKRKAMAEPTPAMMMIAPTPLAAEQQAPTPPNNCVSFFAAGSYNNSNDDLHRLVSHYQTGHINSNNNNSSSSSHSVSNLHHYLLHHQQQQQQQFYNQLMINNPIPIPLPPPQPPAHHSAGSSSSSPMATPPPSFLPAAVSDRLWEWNPFPDQQASRDHYTNNPFK